MNVCLQMSAYIVYFFHLMYTFQNYQEMSHIKHEIPFGTFLPLFDIIMYVESTWIFFLRVCYQGCLVKGHLHVHVASIRDLSGMTSVMLVNSTLIWVLLTTHIHRNVKWSVCCLQTLHRSQ